jgi:hypothetical protein
MDLIDLRGFCGNLRDTKLDLMITGSCRGLLEKPSPYPLPQSGRTGAIGGGGGGPGGLGCRRLERLGTRAPGKKEEENEGTKMECSPWAESDGRMARGGAQQRPAAVSRGGGAPVLDWRRGGA